ncbi:hypothetical protein [Natronoglycomyces albus]|uniref:Uncharacterized protein n=1 Tax=Natronoglycomyces albus TaxID=2811108 RepID=A0A895XQD0_9ACTN|nr:hypothetical protein [Natronoglycomyces albus]QSB05743.1 hypothetical protein JQS30_02095 [Natronoglycomyces albus]
MKVQKSGTNESRVPATAVEGSSWDIETRSFSFDDPLPKPWSVEPTSTHGTLTVETFGPNNIDHYDTGQKHSRIPVVLVDGQPVSSGFGTVRVALPEGRYMVSVQAQGLDRSSVAVPVTIRANGKRELRYATPHDFRYGVGLNSDVQVAIGKLGRPGVHATSTTSNVPWAIGGALLGYIGALVSLFPLWYFALYLQRGAVVDFERDVYIPASPVAILFVIAGIVLALRWKRKREDKRDAVSEEARFFRHVRWPRLDHPAIGKIVALGTELDLPQPSAGRAGIVLDLNLGKRETQLGGFNAPRENYRPWRIAAPAPIVTLDGTELPRGWGRWFFEVEPGSYSLRVDVPDHQGRPSHHSGVPVVADANLPCAAGQTITLLATVDNFYTWGKDDLTGYEATIDLQQA